MAKTVVEEFVAVLGWDVDPKGLNKFNEQATNLKDIVKKASIAVAGAVTAVTALITVTNKQTAVNTNLARSFGLSAEAAENWGFLLSAIGLEASAVTRLMKDMSVRIGQAAAGIGSAETIKDAAKAINIEFDKLQKMKPEEQYITILQAAKDSTDQATALAAAQQLGGRQAAMIVGYLRQQKGTVEEILEAQARINVQTDEGRAGALRFFYALDDVGNAVSGIKALFSGLVGEGIAPVLELFNEWVRANRDLIRTRVKQWAEGFIKVFKAITGLLKTVVGWIIDLVEFLGGLNKALRLTAILFGMWLSFKVIAALQTLLGLTKGLTIAQGLLAARAAATKVAMMGLRAASLGLVALILEDLYQFVTGGESVIGEFNKIIQPKIQEGISSIQDFLLSAMGYTDKEIEFLKQRADVFLTQLPDKIGNALNFAVKLVKSFFSFWISQGEQLIAFMGRIYDSIVSGMQWAIDKVKSGIQTIKGALPSFVVNAMGGTPTPQPTNNVTNNQGGNVAVSNQNNITVNQQPGQSATDLARQIAKQIGEQSASAVRNNASGVVY